MYKTNKLLIIFYSLSKNSVPIIKLKICVKFMSIKHICVMELKAIFRNYLTYNSLQSVASALVSPNRKVPTL